MTKESFAVWASKFESEFAEQRRREEEERLRALPPKEREEAKRWAAKLTGELGVLSARLGATIPLAHHRGLVSVERVAHTHRHSLPQAGNSSSKAKSSTRTPQPSEKKGTSRSTSRSTSGAKALRTTRRTRWMKRRAGYGWRTCRMMSSAAGRSLNAYGCPQCVEGCLRPLSRLETTSCSSTSSREFPSCQLASFASLFSSKHSRCHCEAHRLPFVPK